MPALTNRSTRQNSSEAQDALALRHDIMQIQLVHTLAKHAEAEASLKFLAATAGLTQQQDDDVVLAQHNTGRVSSANVNTTSLFATVPSQQSAEDDSTEKDTQIMSLIS